MPKNNSIKNTAELNRRRDLLFDAFSAESNRGVVLVAASFIDHALELLLRARFSSGSTKPKKAIDPLFKNFGPLATFSAKIKICYAIDLLQDWLYRDLEIIRKLRNSFAHNTEPLRFDDPQVAAFTTHLKGADHAVTVMSKQRESNKESIKKQKKAASSKSGPIARERLRFDITVSYIGALLYSKVVVQNSDASDEFKALFMASRKL